jgi:hypothetical protein
VGWKDEKEENRSMRVASVKPNDLSVVKDDSLILIGDALAVQGLLSKGVDDRFYRSL